MSVRKREWITRKGERKEAWIVDYAVNGSRHLKTFERKKDADAYYAQVSVDVGKGVHVALADGSSRFVDVSMPEHAWRWAISRTTQAPQPPEW